MGRYDTILYGAGSRTGCKWIRRRCQPASVRNNKQKGIPMGDEQQDQQEAEKVVEEKVERTETTTAPSPAPSEQHESD